MGELGRLIESSLPKAHGVKGNGNDGAAREGGLLGPAAIGLKETQPGGATSELHLMENVAGRPVKPKARSGLLQGIAAAISTLFDGLGNGGAATPTPGRFHRPPAGAHFADRPSIDEACANEAVGCKPGSEAFV